MTPGKAAVQRASTACQGSATASNVDVTEHSSSSPSPGCCRWKARSAAAAHTSSLCCLWVLLHSPCPQPAGWSLMRTWLVLLCALCCRQLMPQAPQEWVFAGLNLLRLLLANRIAEFHTDLELIPEQVCCSTQCAIRNQSLRPPHPQLRSSRLKYSRGKA